MKKILILSHEATFTGAPIFLLRLLKFLNQTNSYEFLILFNKSGKLLSEFKSQAKIILVPNNRLRLIFYRLKILIFNPELIISNTIVNSNLLSFVNLENTKLITIVHEMKGVIHLFDELKLNNAKEIISKSSHFIAVSNSVKMDLVQEFKIKEKNIDIIYNGISLEEKNVVDKTEIDQWKDNLNIPKESFIVGSCGSMTWRKGPDIFINILKEIKQNFNLENIYFIWLGGSNEVYWLSNLKEEINSLGLNEHIKFLSEVQDTSNFYNAIDVYISTAREEPFGLTILEAGANSKPCLAFEGTGGPQEILSNKKGILIPYGDTNRAAKEIIKLKEIPLHKEKYSNSIKDAVLNYSSKTTNSKYKEIIDSFII